MTTLGFGDIYAYAESIWGHPVIEAIFSNKTDENEFETSNLPIIEQLYLVRGIMIDNPELINQQMELI